jgi:hypothetical protein
MLNMSRNNLKYLAFFLLILYAGFGAFSSFLHNHKLDWNFHDNCPACRVEMQAQDDKSAILEFMNVLLIPPFSDNLLIDILSNDVTSQIHHLTNSTRAPPPCWFAFNL